MKAVYEITWVEAGVTDYLTTLQAVEEFGKDEWNKIKQGYLPHIVAVRVQ